MSDKAFVEVLVSFRLNGVHRGVGAVIPKADFREKGEWLDLVNMEPPRAVEVDGEQSTVKGGKEKLPGL